MFYLKEIVPFVIESLKLLLSLSVTMIFFTFVKLNRNIFENMEIAGKTAKRRMRKIKLSA